MCKAINVRHSGMNSLHQYWSAVKYQHSHLQDKITDHALMVDYYMWRQHFILNSYNRRPNLNSQSGLSPFFKMLQVNTFLVVCDVHSLLANVVRLPSSQSFSVHVPVHGHFLSGQSAVVKQFDLYQKSHE